MTKKRLLQIIAMNFSGGATARGRYLREHHIFSCIGANVGWQPRTIPLYPELIKLHDNVFVARNVHFETHDVIHHVINRAGLTKTPVPEYVGCIEVMENVFIGADSTVMYGVRIGANVIIGSGSVVTKDLEAGGIYAGIPAKKIGSFAEFVARREDTGRYSWTKHNQAITQEEIKKAWEMFDEQHT